MTRNVEEAVKLYSGDRPMGLFVHRLPEHVAQMNASFEEISALFNTENISDYMNARFDKYLKELEGGDPDAKEAALAELQRSFASLSQQEQHMAELLLNDFLRGDVQTKAGYSFRDYLAEYQADTNQQKIKAMVDNLGVDEQLLTEFMTARVTETDINEYGR